MTNEKTKRVYNRIIFFAPIVFLILTVILFLVLMAGFKGTPFANITKILLPLLFIVSAFVFSILSLRAIGKDRQIKQGRHNYKYSYNKRDKFTKTVAVIFLLLNILAMIFISYFSAFFFYIISQYKYANGFYYSYVSGGGSNDIKIEGLVFKKSTKEITVPEYIKGKKVTGLSMGGLFSVGSGFSDYEKLEKVNLPDTITFISGGFLIDSAFRDCKNLKYINIPESLMRIGHGTFSGCVSLTEITLPDTVEYIGANAFMDTGIWNNAENNGVVYVGKWAIGYKGELSEIELKTIQSVSHTAPFQATKKYLK